MAITVSQALADRTDGLRDDVDIEHGSATITIQWRQTWYTRNARDIGAEDVHTGTCATASVLPAEIGYHADRPSRSTEPGTHIVMATIAGRERPWRICGISDDELQTAAAVLADTGRADRVHRRLTQARRAATVAQLRHARETAEQALTLPANQSLGPYQQAMDRTAALARRAVVGGVLTLGDVLAEIPTLPRQIQPDAADHDTTPAPLILDIADIAERSGLSQATIRAYRARGTAGFPREDVTIGDTPGWDWDTIEAWLTSRPGRGWRDGRH